MHIVLSFAGMAAYATAAAAGTMYLVAHRDLKSARFGAIFRFFPPLATLDRVNHFASIAGFLGLSTGLPSCRLLDRVQDRGRSSAVWGLGAWICIAALALGRILRGLQARRGGPVSRDIRECSGDVHALRAASLNRGSSSERAADCTQLRGHPRRSDRRGYSRNPQGTRSS